MNGVTSRAVTGLAALALIAGCGGDERLSKAETTERVSGAVQSVNGEFQRVFELLGRRGERDRVPATVRKQLSSASEVERREADELAAIEPAAESERAVENFVAAARSQADALASAATRPNLTVAEMADAVEDAEVREALIELERAGLARAPRHE